MQKTFIIESYLIEKYLYKNINVKKACWLALKNKNIIIDIYNILDIKSFKRSYHVLCII